MQRYAPTQPTGDGDAPLDVSFVAGAIDDQGGGRIPDACRRVLGLPTLAPASDTCELWALLWIEAVLRRSASGACTLSWPDVVEAYPSYRLVAEGDPAATDLVPENLADHLVELGRASARAWPWDRVARACRRGELSGYGVDAADAAWMDEGMFSREVLGHLPPLDVLLADLDCLLDPGVAGRLGRTPRRRGASGDNRSGPEIGSGPAPPRLRSHARTPTRAPRPGDDRQPAGRGVQQLGARRPEDRRHLGVGHPADLHRDHAEGRDRAGHGHRGRIVRPASGHRRGRPGDPIQRLAEPGQGRARAADEQRRGATPVGRLPAQPVDAGHRRARRHQHAGRGRQRPDTACRHLHEGRRHRRERLPAVGPGLLHGRRPPAGGVGQPDCPDPLLRPHSVQGRGPRSREATPHPRRGLRRRA